MPRPCKACGKMIEFVEVPGRSKKNPVDARPVPVALDDRCGFVGWDEKTMAPVHGWVMNAAKRDEAEAFAKAHNTTIAWAWMPHWKTCSDPDRFRAKTAGGGGNDVAGSAAPRPAVKPAGPKETQLKLF